MRPVDARLLRCGRETRAYLVGTVLLGMLTALLVIAQAWLLARIIAGAVSDGRDLASLRTPLAALLTVVVIRAAVAWYVEVAAHHTSARVKSQLRCALAERVARLAPSRLAARRRGDMAALATRGIDALDGYFSRYVPQLALAVIVPVAVLVVVLTQDWISAAILAVTLPLIPIFMALIGMRARRHTDRQLRTLQLLSGHFLDVVGGLATLKIFGRSRAQVETIRDVTNEYRRTTNATLRLAFLSSLVLEFLASIAVALVAVSVGLRLLDGDVGLRTALFVLVLAPEAYLPLRLVGTHYHASAEGLSAAAQVFEVLDEPLPARGTRSDVPDVARTPICIEDATVVYPGRNRPALDRVTLTLEPGEVLAITGPSGCGKSTLLAALLGFVTPERGAIRIGDTDLADLDPDAWRRHIAWVPQHPHLFAASLADNIRLGRPDAPPVDIERAVADAGLSGFVDCAPRGLETMIGERGAGLSGGERKRVALARAFVRDAPLLLLDEPTANLDGATEADVIDALARLARGRTVVLVAHRPSLLRIADRVLALDRFEAYA